MAITDTEFRELEQRCRKMERLLREILNWADDHQDGAPDASARDRDAAMIYSRIMDAEVIQP